MSANNVLLIHDPMTDEVFRVVVPDTDAQLNTATFHGDGEQTTIIPMEVFLAYPDPRDLKIEVTAARQRK